MGRISPHNRSKLASSAVGVNAQGNAVSTVASGVVRLGAALERRQTVLDRAQATQAYYKYVSRDTLASAQLQKEYMSKKNLDPLTYQSVYERQTDKIAGDVKKLLPTRLHSKFDILIGEQKAKQSVRNTKWVIDIQNANAIQGFNDQALSFNTEAGSALTSSDYGDILENVDGLVEANKSILTSASMSSAVSKIKKNITLSHLDARIDNNNGGDPISLDYDLKNNKEYRQKLVGALGEKGVQTVEKQIAGRIAKLGADLDFQQLFGNSADVQESVTRIFQGKMGLAETNQKVRSLENARDILIAQNQPKVNSGRLAQIDKQIKIMSSLSTIAGNVNDERIITNPLVRGGLSIRIKDVLSRYSGKQYRSGAIEANIVRLQGRIVPTFSDVLESLTPALIQGIIQGIIPVRSAQRKQEKITVAPRNYSEYLSDLYEVSAETIREREKGNINNEVTETLLSKVIAKMSVPRAYDRVVAGDDWFSTSYNAFSDFADGINIPGNVDQRRQIRDKYRAQMMDMFIKNFATSGIEYPNIAYTNSLVRDVRNAFSQQLNASRINVQKGDFISHNGTTKEVIGTNQSTGETVYKDKKLADRMDNR